MGNDTAIEMFVGGLVMDPQSQHPVVILKDESGNVTLPIWIGVSEATSIASALKNLTLPRPLTHDLITNLFDEMSIQVQRIFINDLKEQTYFAEIIISHGDKVMIIDSRPSDALAIAVRTSAPIFVAAHVIEAARSAVPPTQLSGDPTGQKDAPPGEAQGDQPPETPPQADFNLLDKTKWKDLLADLDPDDFKFKM